MIPFATVRTPFALKMAAAKNSEILSREISVLPHDRVFLGLSKASLQTVNPPSEE